MSDKELTITQLKRNVNRSISSIQKLVLDVEYWNKYRVDSPPFECGAEKVALKYLYDHLQELDRVERQGGPINREAIQRVVDVLRKSQGAEKESS